MTENEQELRDEQDRCGYADVRPKEKQHRELLIKSASTSTIKEPTAINPEPPLPSQQTSIDTDKPLMNNFSRKRNQEKQPQTKHHHPTRYQTDPINDNRLQQINNGYLQPQPNISTPYTTYTPSTSQVYPSTSALKSANYGQMHAPSSSTAPPMGSVQPYVQQAPYPPQQPSYSALNEPKSDSRQYSPSEFSILLDRLSRMESKLEKISDLEAEVRALKREKETPILQTSRSDVDYSTRMRRRASIVRTPSERHERHERQFYNNSADQNRYNREDYYNQPQNYYPQQYPEYYSHYDSPSYFEEAPPPREDMKPSQQYRRRRAQSFDKEQKMGYQHQYYANKYSSNGYY